MGYAARAREARTVMLQGAKIVVDVQHIYRTGKHARDQGSLYTLANGLRVTEASAALTYAAALAAFLRARGAAVLTNEPGPGILVGPYSTRNLAAAAWHAHAYLACHVNAGGGSYAAFEYMSMTIGARWVRSGCDRSGSHDLAGAMLPQLRTTFPTVILGSKRVSLSAGQRGAVCIERVPASCAAIICEPFFGDNPHHQPLLAAPELVRVGEALGQGVVDWWKSRRIVV